MGRGPGLTSPPPDLPIRPPACRLAGGMRSLSETEGETGMSETRSRKVGEQIKKEVSQIIIIVFGCFFFNCSCPTS